MRVFCPEHHRGFFAPRQNPIKCENRGHILGEIDFSGQEGRRGEIAWQYCCNCEHFSPVEGGEGLERCSVCARQSSILYLCDRCQTISFESRTAVQTKNFAISANGIPEPSCPGCLQEAPADLYEHSCDELGRTLFTALGSCPICHDRLDVGPSFPATVTQYLKLTRARNKFNVTFDYEGELFVPVGDGEFVVVNLGAELESIVLPRPSRFNTKRDFYDFYQDFYHCAHPGAGEIQIIEPATVQRIAGGWKPQTPGTLEVLSNQTRGNVAAVGPEKKAVTTSDPVQVETELTTCQNCGAQVETKYAFCWKCGHSLADDLSERAETITAAIEDEDQTAEHNAVARGVPIFSWAVPRESEHAASGSGAVVKLVAVAVIGLLVMGLGLYVLLRWTSTGGAVDVRAVEEAQPQTSAEPNGSSPARESVKPQSSTVATADEALSELSARRVLLSDPAAAAEALEFLSPYERQFADDYRFPFERARLLVKAQGLDFETRAFAALFLAAEKAIARGKAMSMLQSLHNNRTGDFNPLYNGHPEWRQLVSALRSKNANLLKRSS